MLRVLHVVRRMNIGGLENIVREIILNADRKAVICDCLIFDTGDADYEKELSNAGVRVFKLSKPSRLKWNVYRELKAFLVQNNEYDIVHTHMAFSNGIVALAAKKSGIKCVVSHSHGVCLPGEGKSIRKIYEFAMRKMMCAYSKGLLACSQEAGEYLFGKKEFRKRGRIFINGIELNKYSFNSVQRMEIRKKLGCSSSIVLGTVGSLVRAKNQKKIIDIVYEMRHEPIVALLVGDGPLKEELLQYATDKKVMNKIIFLGKQRNVVPYLQAMDVFIFPSVSEGFGIALIEAQANGVPCVVSDNIQNEAKIASNIETVGVESNTEEWVNAVKKAVAIGRVNNTILLEKHGMDLDKNCDELFDWYERVVEGDSK